AIASSRSTKPRRGSRSRATGSIATLEPYPSLSETVGGRSDLANEESNGISAKGKRLDGCMAAWLHSSRHENPKGEEGKTDGQDDATATGGCLARRENSGFRRASRLPGRRCPRPRALPQNQAAEGGRAMRGDGRIFQRHRADCPRNGCDCVWWIAYCNNGKEIREAGGRTEKKA